MADSATKIDIFVPTSDDMIRICVGPCGEARPASAFPIIAGRPGVRLAECISCRHEATKAKRDQVATVPTETDTATDPPDVKYFPAGGRRERASQQREAIVDAVGTVVAAHRGEAITIVHIYEEVFDSVDFVPREALVRDAVRLLANDDERFVRVARDTYSWAPDGKVPPPPAPAHVVRMIELRRSGRTLADIGKEFGVGRERVRQLLKKYGGPTAQEIRELRVAEALTAHRDHESAVGAHIRGALEGRGPMTVADVVEATGIDAGDVAKFWPQELAHLRLHTSASVENRWSDEAVLEAIREAGLYEFPLTTNAYSDLVSQGQVKGPSMPRIWQRFGSWTAACEAAGVVAGQTMRPHYESRWSDDDLLEIARQYLLDPDSPNSAHRFDEWKRECAPDGPSFQTLRNRFGSWTEVKRRALAQGPW